MLVPLPNNNSNNNNFDNNDNNNDSVLQLLAFHAVANKSSPLFFSLVGTVLITVQNPESEPASWVVSDLQIVCVCQFVESRANQKKEKEGKGGKGNGKRVRKEMQKKRGGKKKII